MKFHNLEMKYQAIIKFKLPLNMHQANISKFYILQLSILKKYFLMEGDKNSVLVLILIFEF